MYYFIKTPSWLKRLYPRRLWSRKETEKNVYLTFDDGPHPVATPFVLEELKKYKALATFFCIGKNVMAHSDIYQRILEEGHRTGNHTQDHLNGWKTSDEVYINNIAEAAKYISSNLFRPPYGRIRSSQVKKLNEFAIVMWDVLSGDFDESISGEKCLDNVLRHTKPGSIIVFHDSQKALPRLQYALPQLLQWLQAQGYNCKSL